MKYYRTQYRLWENPIPEKRICDELAIKQANCIEALCDYYFHLWEGTIISTGPIRNLPGYLISNQREILMSPRDALVLGILTDRGILFAAFLNKDGIFEILGDEDDVYKQSTAHLPF